jgi:hypothetical protein
MRRITRPTTRLVPTREQVRTARHRDAERATYRTGTYVPRQLTALG